MFNKAAIEKYFIGEKQGSLLLLIVGAIALILAIICWGVMKSSFYNGAGYPLLIFGLLFCIISYVVYKRSDSDLMRNVYAYDMNPDELRNVEFPRMQKVMKSFVLYRYSQLFLLAIGILLYGYYARNLQQDFWRGVGLALALMAMMALVADYFAENRGKVYIQGIESFIAKK